MAFSSGLRAFLAQRPIMSLFSASALSYACYSLFSSSKSSTSPFQSLLSILSSRPSFDAVTIPASHSSPSASSTTGVVDTHFHSSDGPVQLFTMKKSAPQQSPDWLLELFANPQFELIDLRRHLDPAYHLLYGSLHKKHGIETYYLFVEKRPSDFSTAESVSSSASSSSASSSASISDDSLSSSSSSSSSFAPHVYAVFRVGPALCGHRNIIHGGLTAALIDDISGAAVVSAFGSGQFTVNLQVNYLSPIPADSFVLVRGQAWKQEGRKTSVRVTVEDGQGKKYAEGTALYVKPKEGVHKVIEKARRELKDNDLTPSEVDAKKLINQTV